MAATNDFKQVSSLLNFAHPTSFVIDIPIPEIGIGTKLETIGYNSKHFAMNIQNFTLNRLQLGSNEVQRSAYKLIMPNQTDMTEKQFTINYKLSSGWQQYYFLCLWYQANLKVIKHIDDEKCTELTGVTNKYTLESFCICKAFLLRS
mgnify:CR=1 FL=1